MFVKTHTNISFIYSYISYVLHTRTQNNECLSVHVYEQTTNDHLTGTYAFPYFSPRTYAFPLTVSLKTLLYNLFFRAQIKSNNSRVITF